MRKFTIFSLLITSVLVIIFPGYGDEGLTWGRFQILPEISITETYSDNVFKSDDKNSEDGKNKSEYNTEISPELRMNYAIQKDNTISFTYEGEFHIFNKYDNLNANHHSGDLFWRIKTPKGSRVKIGTKIKESSVQPFSETSEGKEFIKWDAYASGLLASFSSTNIGASYKHSIRRFEDEHFNGDDFNRNHASLYLVYKRLPMTPLLLEYNYVSQDNNDVEKGSRDLVNHKFYVGARWEATEKITGALKLGYMHTDFRVLEDFSGFSMDTNLKFRFSEITTLKLAAHRTVTPTTRAERDTEDYFVSTGTEISILHHKWEPLFTEIDFTYKNRVFQENESDRAGREDRFYKFGAHTKYFINKKCAIGLKYQYRMNESNLVGHDYTENRVQLGFTFSM